MVTKGPLPYELPFVGFAVVGGLVGTGVTGAFVGPGVGGDEGGVGKPKHLHSTGELVG